jgi:hypothetical protein
MPARESDQQNVIAKWQKQEGGIGYAKEEETEKAKPSKEAKEILRPGGKKKKVEIMHPGLEFRGLSTLFSALL